MASEEAPGYCSHCKKKVKVRKNKLNHIFHFIMTIITLGIWAIIWIFLALSNAFEWRCVNCGHRAKKRLFD
jgi:DNA-directed RNA polymerase subunit RPC12/RpoP